MNVKKEISDYIAGQPEAKQTDLQALHKLVLGVMPGCKRWFLDGKDSTGKVVSNPNIGYGQYTIRYADGSAREFYQVGLSANQSGISVYIMGVKDRTYLAKTFEKKLGKAKVTGYCIKFKALKDIHTDTLKEAIRYGVKASSEK